MKRFYIFHLGIGNVGRNLVLQIIDQMDALRDKYLIDLVYCGLYNSHGGYFDTEGFEKSKLVNILAELVGKKARDSRNMLDMVNEMHQPFILIDTTSSEKTFSMIFSTLARGGYAVLSNKKPLTIRQEQYDLLHQLGQERLFYETTVGAGLPVIRTLKTLLATGDEILEIKGCFSGTLGFLFSAIEDGSKFSGAVIAAKEKGYTEPDPRDDLSGLDVARKALILSRILGRHIELSDIDLISLYPESMGNLTVNEFLRKVNQLDDLYQRKIDDAKKKDQTLRFVATITARKCTVGLEKVSKNSDLGGLKGPDNMIIFKTKRYLDRPLVVKGPGAGPEVTAAGVLGDILQIAGVC